MMVKSGVKSAFIVLLTLLIALLPTTKTTAQGTLTTGRIFDADTHEPLGFVNIHIKGTNNGTTTDSAGAFALSITPQQNILEISIIGYERKLYKITPGAKSVSITVKSASLQLKEVEVKPGKRRRREVDTAALYVFARVIEHKKENNPQSIPAYYFREHSKIITSLINVSPKLLNARILKPFSFFWEVRDSTPAGEEYIPLVILEEYNETYHRNSPAVNRRVIYYRHMSGFKRDFIANYVSDQLKTIDIYNNVYVIAGKSFTSPFAPLAKGTYTYHILDTIRTDSSVFYKLNFVARNKADVALKGYAVIDSATWGIQTISFKPNEKSNVNFLTDYSVEQQFKNTGNGWLMQHETVNARGNLLEKQKRIAIYLHKVTARDSVDFNRTIPANVASASDDIVMKDAYRKNRSFLDTLRIATLDSAENHIYHSFDTALTVPAFWRLKWVAKFITSGNLRAGPLDFGRLFYVVSRNAVEGYRVRLGVFTNENFSRNVWVYGQAAYGFTDKKWKYEVDVHINLPSRSARWNQLWLQSKDDMVVLGQENALLSYDNILTLLSPNSKNNKVMHTSVQSIQYQHDWFKGFSTNLGFSFNRFYSAERGFEFNRIAADNKLIPVQGFKTTELSAEFRYCANDQYADVYGFRYFIPTTKPSFTFKYTWGIKGAIGDYAYHKFQAGVKQVIYMPVVGYGKLNASAGYIYGQAPYPTAFISSANIGFFKDETSFQQTKLFEFTHDKFISLWYEHHFEGLLFNHIPYINKLKLREFVSVKALWGTMSNSNKTLLQLPDGMHTAYNVPYVEVGFGVENILKILQVSFNWRATYRNVPGAPNFGVKIGIRPSF